MAKKQNNKSVWGIVIAVLVFLFILGYIFAGVLSLLVGGTEVQSGNIAVVPVKGIISTENSGDLFGTVNAVSSTIVADIEKASGNPQIKAILLEINSPGGAPVATDEVVQAIKSTNKTVVAWIRETGASGAYWIASAADYVVANRMSITGSIGVYGSYLDFSGLLTDWNVTYERLIAGEYKDLGVPYRVLEPDEKRLLQKKLDILHEEFKSDVQNNRKLSDEEIQAAGNGEFFLGSEAKQLGLVDELGGKGEAIAFIENKLGIKAQLIAYSHEKSFIEVLSGLLNDRSFYLGKGLADGMQSSNVGMLK